MDVLATDLADYLVRKGVRFISSVSHLGMLTRQPAGTVSRDAPRFGTGGGLGRGTPVSAQRAFGAGLQAAA